MSAKTTNKNNDSMNIEKVDNRITLATYYGNTYRYVNGKPRHTANTYGAWGKIADLDKNGKPNYRAGVLPIKVTILKK